MITAFHDAAAFKHIDAIGVFHSAEAVGNHKTRAAGAEAFEGFGGFYLMEVPNLDVLVDLVKLLPAYDMELRPVDESMTG